MSSTTTTGESTTADIPEGLSESSGRDTDASPSSSTIPSVTNEDAPQQQQQQQQRPPPASTSLIEEGLVNEMKNFDNLLRMLSVYRDNPDFRGNPDDKNIEEIAKVLSGFIGDDVDNFLSDDEDGGEEVKSDSNLANNHDSADNVNDINSNNK